MKDQRGSGAFRPGLRLFLLVALITTVLVGIGAVLVVRNEAEQRDRTVAATLGFSEAAARSADQVLQDDLALLDLLATSSVLSEVDPSSVQAVLDAVDVGSAGFTGGITWIGPDGTVKAATGRKKGAPVTDLSHEPYVEAILDRGAASYVGRGFVDDGVPGLSILVAVPAKDADDRTVGVVMGSLSLDRVAQHLTGFRFGGNDLIVLDRADRVVIAGTADARLEDVSGNPLVRMLRATAPRSAVDVTDPLGRQHRLVTAALSPNGDWLLIVSRSTYAAFSADRRNLELELAGLALAAFCAIVIAWRGARRLDLLQDFANSTAETERIGRERATRLRLAIAALSTSLTRRDLAQSAVGAGREALGAKAAAMVLREDENAGMLRLMASHGYPTTVDTEWDRYLVTDTTAGGAAVSLGRPIFLDTATMAEAFPETAAVHQHSGCASWAALPLRAEGEVFGAITLGWDDETALAPERQLEATSYAAEVAGALAWVRAREVEHEFALDLQRGLLPNQLPSGGDIVVHAEYLPSNGVLEVGGDWYDVLERPDGAIMLVVGDVVGHGTSAIAAMGQLSSVCRAVADEASPVRMLDYLDRLARRVPNAVGTTAVCVLIEADRRAARFSIAGHPRPLLVEGGEVRELDGAVSIPLAYGETARTEATIALHRPSTLVLFTDGLLERRDETYLERLAHLRRIAAETPARDLCGAIVDQMTDADDNPDDTVVMVVHLPAPPP